MEKFPDIYCTDDCDDDDVDEDAVRIQDDEYENGDFDDCVDKNIDECDEDDEDYEDDDLNDDSNGKTFAEGKNECTANNAGGLNCSL